MKKIIAIVLVAGLAACAKEEAPAPTPTPTPAPAPTPTPAPTPANAADIQPEQADAVVAELEKEIEDDAAKEP